MALFFVGHEERTAFSTHAELVAGFFKIEHRHFLVVKPCGEEGCFVHQVFEVCTGKSRRSLGNSLHVNIRSKRHLALLQVNLQNFFTALEVGESHHNLTVKTTRTQKCLVEHIRTVRGGNQNHAFVSGKTVHFNKQLVQSLFAFVVTATETCTTLAPHGIDFVDEQNARSVFLACFKQVTYAACAHTNEHFHKVRTGHAKERHTSFASDSAGEESLTRTRRANKERTLWNATAQSVVFLRILQKFDEFL